MTAADAIDLAHETVIVALKLGAPVMLLALTVGLVIAFLQALTQIQEMTLTFVPKLLVVGLVLTLSGHWMLSELTGYVHELFQGIPTLLGSG